MVDLEWFVCSPPLISLSLYCLKVRWYEETADNHHHQFRLRSGLTSFSYARLSKRDKLLTIRCQQLSPDSLKPLYVWVILSKLPLTRFTDHTAQVLEENRHSHVQSLTIVGTTHVQLASFPLGPANQTQETHTVCVHTIWPNMPGVKPSSVQMLVLKKTVFRWAWGPEAVRGAPGTEKLYSTAVSLSPLSNQWITWSKLFSVKLHVQDIQQYFL